MNTLSILTIGFSIIAATMLFVVYVFFLKNVSKSWHAIGVCFILQCSLSCLQLEHFHVFLNNIDPLNTLYYRFLIFLVPSMFYFFSRAILFPETQIKLSDIIHLAPIPLVFFLTKELAIPIAFLLGTGYCIWLVGIVYKLRAHRKHFDFELFFFGFFAVLALIVLTLGFSISYIDNRYFYTFYSNGIGLAYILITASFIIWPGLLGELAEAIKLSYGNSTLKNVDITAKVKKLELLMSAKIFQDENLNLSMVAEEVKLTSHQLSELINTRFGLNFSRYIRVQRIEEAKRLLKNDRKSSILSISMEAGFKSQSSFYTAFNEVTGKSPGQYR